MRRMSSGDRSTPSMLPSTSSYMTLSSTSTISTSVSIHGGLSTAPRFQQRQSRLSDQQQQHQPLPQQLPQQQQQPHQQSLRRRPRPLSADMSLTRAPFSSSYANNNHNNYPGTMSTSKSEFFRVVRSRLMEEFEGPEDARDLSSESLLADSSSVSMESSLDYFVNKEHADEDDDDDIETPTPTTPDASSHCRKGVSSLDSLLDNESAGAGMSIQSQQLTMSSRAKSNSLPKSAFGSLQLKVQEIRAQLDVLKTSSDVRRVLQQVCPPPRPQGQENTQHPNTPAHGFEYMMPPNVVKEQQQGSSNTSWSNFFPVFPTSAIDGSACSSNPERRPLYPAVHAQHQQHHQQQQQQQASSMFQSPPSSSQDTDSVSPLSMSPSRTSSPATAQQAATLSLSIAPSNTSAAALAMMGTSGSSSPSTLSASSSNSLPTSVSRPSVLKIPQSQSLNSFPYNGNNNMNNNNCNNNCNNNLKNFSKAYFDDDAAVSQVGRLFFFYDVLSTQEKISKVGWRLGPAC